MKCPAIKFFAWNFLQLPIHIIATLHIVTIEKSGLTFPKKHSKTQLDEKTYLFMMLLAISFFSIFPMHVRRRLSYIIKDDSSEGL